MKRIRARRVDMQVSILTAALVLGSILIIFSFYYQQTYGDMIESLNERAFSIYQYLDDSLDKSTFAQINSIDDRERESYLQMKKLLEDVKESSDVRYLYTAKKNDQGEFIYVVDGLSFHAPDFRNPGDPIEPELYGDMQLALDGQIVLPQGIKDTTWGKIFITYFPVHDGDEVIGVLGIEFEAEHQFDTYRSLRIFTPLIALLACGIAVALALFFFRRISNPTYQDMVNTDQLTQLKSRNAYDVDLANLATRRGEEGMGVSVLDLNNLKWVNDTRGHSTGDDYIRAAAEAMRRAAASSKSAAYRIGGDEFVILTPRATEEKLCALAEQVTAEFESLRPKNSNGLSIAIGCAVFDRARDRSLSDTSRRADKEMYRHKQSMR